MIKRSAIVLLLLVIGCKKSNDPAAPKASDLKTITTKSGIEMVLIPAGQFTMGDKDGDEDEKPLHPVKVSAFYMDRFEVTQKSYRSLMGTNPARFKGDDLPVERLSWRMAIKYCNMRSMKEGLHPCYNADTLECDFAADGYRLPTEAEWEYACRAGSSDPITPIAPAAVGEVAWCKANSNQTTHPVGQKKANAFGLYDMLGNVAEWCNDRYGEKAYSDSASADPHGPATGDKRILRGGHWKAAANLCGPTVRDKEDPGLADVCFGYDAYGFRCVRAAK